MGFIDEWGELYVCVSLSCYSSPSPHPLDIIHDNIIAPGGTSPNGPQRLHLDAGDTKLPPRRANFQGGTDQPYPGELCLIFFRVIENIVHDEFKSLLTII